jgi:hypothetical protein
MIVGNADSAPAFLMNWMSIQSSAARYNIIGFEASCRDISLEHNVRLLACSDSLRIISILRLLENKVLNSTFLGSWNIRT